MYWTKIPTNLLKQRVSDNELAAIVKYQLLWADLEYQPDEETASRYLTKKQMEIVKHWLNAIEAQVTCDIRLVEKKRTSVKISYRKNKELKKSLAPSLASSLASSLAPKDNILNKNNNIFKNSNSQSSRESEVKKEKIEKEKEKEKKENFIKTQDYGETILIGQNFKIDYSDKFFFPYRQAPDKLTNKIEHWIIDKKLGKEIKKNFICTQITNFSQRDGCITELLKPCA